MGIRSTCLLPIVYLPTQLTDFLTGLAINIRCKPSCTESLNRNLKPHATHCFSVRPAPLSVCNQMDNKPIKAAIMGAATTVMAVGLVVLKDAKSRKYVLVGWEGSAHDSRILDHALSRPRGFKVPEGKYYLGDTGYGVRRGIISPYRELVEVRRMGHPCDRCWCDDHFYGRCCRVWTHASDPGAVL
ncbi:hypothetical protein Vadar_010197 [Vaccinium darrowii]|uniref:Uncharacterized protein n=1 Tax=Vaccinium darrowii TaxID=229202 RepID=A0ACB7ZIM9_9ERIC|nr:hypothetical protein Vadar_010197 [Vaccinium darrowii]